MRRARFFLVVLACGLVAAVPGVALARTVAEGDAYVTPAAPEFPTSGIPSTVNAVVEIRDTGSTDVVRGEAQGMDPSKTYVSLIYSTPATGPDACAAGPPLSFQQMYLGVWTVDSDGNGQLVAVKSHTGNTSPTPAVLQPFLAFVSGGAVTDLSLGDTYVALGPTTTSVSVREVLPGAGPFTGLMLPQRISCGAVSLDND